MKKIFFGIIGLALLASCEKVDCPNEGGCDVILCEYNGIDTCKFPGVAYNEISGLVDITDSTSNTIKTSSTTGFKKVLIEEFTGFKCNNCPVGAQEIETMKQTYGDTVVTVAIHTGGFAKPDPSNGFITDYNTDAGDAYRVDFLIASYPAGVIDQVQFSSKFSQSIVDWEPSFLIRKAEPNVVNLELTSIYNTSSDGLMGIADLEFNSSYTDPLNVIFMIIEDKIIDIQDSAGVILPNYEHNHVLRGTLGGLYGVVATTAAASTSQTVQVFSDALDISAWKEDDCTLVAFVYNALTKEVLQVDEVHIK